MSLALPGAGGPDASPRRAVSPLLEVRRPHCTLNCDHCNSILEDHFKHMRIHEDSIISCYATVYQGGAIVGSLLQGAVQPPPGSRSCLPADPSLIDAGVAQKGHYGLLRRSAGGNHSSQFYEYEVDRMYSVNNS